MTDFGNQRFLAPSTTIFASPGVDEVRLVPDALLAPAIREACRDAHCARGAVAYVTLDPASMWPVIPRLLSGAGFLVVDIHCPTRLELLTDLSLTRANVFLHMRRALYPDRGKRSTDHRLMHAKLLLLDRARGRSSLFVGSHNWTNAAMEGLNLEASLCVDMATGCPLHHDVVRYLERVRDESDAFDPELLAIYRQIQGSCRGREDKPEIVHVLDVEGPLTCSSFVIFTSDEKTENKLNKVKGRAVIRCQSGGTQVLYRAHIGGAIVVKESAVTLKELYFCEDYPFPLVILGPDPIPNSVIGRNDFYGIVIVDGSLEGYDLEVIERSQRLWEWRSEPMESSDLEGQLAPTLRHVMVQRAYITRRPEPEPLNLFHDEPKRGHRQKPRIELLQKMILRKTED